jgi:hypothetical protein
MCLAPHILQGARINERPRKSLQFETPERFKACVASTGWPGMLISDVTRIGQDGFAIGGLRR